MADSNGVSVSAVDDQTKRPDTKETGLPARADEKFFKVYRRRWAVLATVALLNVSNASIWINISPIATKVADYYQRDLVDINWFSLVFLLISIPFCFISTFSVNRLGLRPAIHIGAALNCLGGIGRAIGTSGLTSNPDTQFAISLTGQITAAMAQSFLLFIPTKVSQLWFPDSARAISTTILSLSNPLGIVVAMVIAPLTVNSKEDFPTVNWIFMGIAIAAEVVTLISVTRSKPPTPPSASAEEGDEIENRPSYLKQLKETFSSLAYWLLLLAFGCGVGLFSALATVTQQILCPLGYSDDFAGLASAVMILCGFVGSAAIGIYVDKTKKFTPVVKICYGIATIMAIIMLEMFMVPFQPAPVAIFSGLFGLFGIGAYPIGLELAVEATYPVDQTISTAFIFMSGQFQGVIIIAMIGGLARDQKAKYTDIQVCTKSDISEIEPKDYTVSLLCTMSLLVFFVALTILFMETPYKRLEAEKAVLRRRSTIRSGSSPPSHAIEDTDKETPQANSRTPPRERATGEETEDIL